MHTILYNIVMLITRVHNYLLTLNNQFENSFTDKELHFLIIGAFGIALVLLLHPIFLWLSKTGHTMVISFLYVLTVVLVLTFAIEIGQGYYGTGAMELDDVIYGVAGFLAFFAAFSVVRGIIHMITRAFRDDDDDQDPEWLR
ncbi:MAG: hypothetical protein IKF54_06045 [Eubacterium sp.]|nr:hypothetical protein [Eubacterium sp.]